MEEETEERTEAKDEGRSMIQIRSRSRPSQFELLGGKGLVEDGESGLRVNYLGILSLLGRFP